jgi:hypothetical protein
LTAYTAGDTSGTVTRGQEGTSDIDHDSGVTWLCGPLADDLATSSGAATTITSNQQTADYTLALSDAGCVVELEGSSSGDTPHESLYVPPHADVPFPEGTIVELCDVGPSLPIVIQAESGVTLDIPPAASVTSPGQWSTARLRQRFIDEWVVDNDWALSTGGATPVTTIVQDSFTDVDGTAVSAHVPEIGDGWNLEGSSTNGGSHIFGDRLEVNGNSFLLSQATPPSADYQVSCQFYGLGSGSSSNVGVFVRASEDADGQTGYTLIMTSGGLYLQYFVDGTYEGSLAGPLSGTDGDTWTLRIEGETLTVLQNGTEVWSGADSTITQVGTVAVSGGWDGSEPVYMDNLVATTLA